MKTFLVTVSLALAGVSSAQAQIFRPSVGNSALAGAVAGSLIGGHNGDRWAQGAVIGAAAGALIGAALAPEPMYAQPPPVYQSPASYGQQVYGQRVYTQAGATVVQVAPGVPNAPVVPMAPMVPEQGSTQVVQAQPQVVYVQSAPQVVYVPAPSQRVYYAAPPIIGFGFGYYSGPRYYDRGYYGPVYRGGPRFDYGHRRGR